MQIHNYNLVIRVRLSTIVGVMTASISSTSTIEGVNVTSVAKTQTPISIACARLKAAGLRITQPRIAILTALIKRGQPTSIEQIHEDLDDGSCDLVTVYRCLSAFEEIGLVRRSFFHNGTSLYTITLGEEPLYHVICKETNKVEEIDAETTAELRRSLAEIEEKLKARGYTQVTHVAEFFGIAPKKA